MQADGSSKALSLKAIAHWRIDAFAGFSAGLVCPLIPDEQIGLVARLHLKISKIVLAAASLRQVDFFNRVSLLASSQEAWVIDDQALIAHKAQREKVPAIDTANATVSNAQKLSLGCIGICCLISGVKPKTPFSDAAGTGRSKSNCLQAKLCRKRIVHSVA